LHYFAFRPKALKPDKKIATYHFLLELVTILLTLTVYQVIGMHVQTFFIILFSWWLFALVMIDLNYYLLPDQLTLSLLWLGLLANLHGLFIPLEKAVCGAVFAYFVMWAIDSIYYLVRGRNGLGEGDWKLLAAIAAWIGFVPTLYVLAGAAILGSIWGIAAVMHKKIKLHMPLAFGPFLCFSAWLFALCRPFLPIHV
jgi:leader peptidase (prepilin peptidase) / N-methyltransferase